jgi:hypothetical protein
VIAENQQLLGLLKAASGLPLQQDRPRCKKLKTSGPQIGPELQGNIHRA